MTDEIDIYIGELLDTVREKFDSQLDGRVIPEMVEFMRTEPSAKALIEIVQNITVALTLQEVVSQPEKLMEMLKK